MMHNDTTNGKCLIDHTYGFFSLFSVGGLYSSNISADGIVVDGRLETHNTLCDNSKLLLLDNNGIRHENNLPVDAQESCSC